MFNFTKRFIILLLLPAILFISCKKDKTAAVAPQFVFKHVVGSQTLQQANMEYTNLAGNLYEVDQLQYFISDIQFKKSDGQTVSILADQAIHYIDLDIPSTLSWNPADEMPVADYQSVTFVFGINEAKNKTGLFVNPPERDMFWPDMMGGGYHYMKMNGKWKAGGDTIKAFNLHLGIGMNDAGTEFYQNYFTVTLPLNIHSGTLLNVFTITMDIEKWFEAPNLWDWNIMGGQIMQNQDAMRKACENGANAFRISHLGKDN